VPSLNACSAQACTAVIALSPCEIAPGCVADRHYAWVLQSAFRADGVELRSHIFGRTYDAQACLPLHLYLNDRRERKYGGSRFAERAQQRKILEFTQHDRTNAVGFEPEIQISA